MGKGMLDMGGEAGASGMVKRGFDRHGKRKYSGHSKPTPRPLDKVHAKPSPSMSSHVDGVDSSTTRTKKHVGI